MSKNANGRRKAILVRLTDEEHAALIRFARERGIHAAEVMRAEIGRASCRERV